MLHKNNPDAACMCEIHRKDGEKEQCCILLGLAIEASLSRITPASQLLSAWLHILLGQSSISSFVLRT